MIDCFTNKSVRRHYVGRFFTLAVAASLFFASCRKPEQIRIDGQAQGTYYSIQYYDDQQRNLQPQVDSLLAAFDLEASLWVDSSLLRRLNANVTDSISPLMADMLEKSLWMCDYSDGAFDCRIGRLVQVWGFSFRERKEPDARSLNALRRAAAGRVSQSAGRLVKQCPDTELDFNAIAQGYSVDLLAAMFDSLGIESYLIDVGGEVIGRGAKPDGSPWRVGIERPAVDSISAPEVQMAIALHDCSVVTSGSYRKYYERDGVKYSHTIDPATGCPVRHSLLSVSVVDSTAWLADAMATAYMVMGLERGREFIASHPYGPGTSAVLFIYDSAGTMCTYATPQFEKLIIKH